MSEVLCSEDHIPGRQGSDRRDHNPRYQPRIHPESARGQRLTTRLSVLRIYFPYVTILAYLRPTHDKQQSFCSLLRRRNSVFMACLLWQAITYLIVIAGVLDVDMRFDLEARRRI